MTKVDMAPSSDSSELGQMQEKGRLTARSEQPFSSMLSCKVHLITTHSVIKHDSTPI
ncbi:hypothetical protein [Planktothrix tepida]|uniref:hypothetical protein n=1 Tax=Planktothrix tepida TaxID=1678309 RepID=UPI0020B37089|nr:hypothetical protein [Planktothrix tepida]